ncbi:MAG: helix-turn-helix domain-containing protein [Bacillota bacterium]
MTFGEKVRIIREARGWSQQDLAAKIGMSPGYIAQVETGRTEPSFQALQKLVQVLGMEAAKLLDPAIIIPYDLPGLPDRIREFLLKDNGVPYVEVAREAAERGLTPEQFKDIVNFIVKYWEK